MQTEIVKLCESCEKKLNLTSAALSQSYYYDSLPMCVIDAVFSIGVKYASTQNVVASYCQHFGLREYNPNRDASGDRHTITQLIENMERLGAEERASVLFHNHQRTSSRNGILKAEAVLRFAKVLQKCGVERLQDMKCSTLPEEAEQEIKQIPGQKSGLALHYFYMLAGDDHWAKPDRHVLGFITASTGRTPSVPEAQNLLEQATAKLKLKYSNLNVRLLDYTIWDYMAHGGSTGPKVKNLDEQVAGKIRELYRITEELEELLPERHYSLDGHLIGSIGEALAARWYGLELFPAGKENHDAKAPDGRLVQIKVTQIDGVALSSEPEWLLVLKLYKDGTFSEIYNGPGKVVWENCGEMVKTGQRPISLTKLTELQKRIAEEDRLLRNE